MKTIDSENAQTPKRAYSPPLIEKVEIDNEISVVMYTEPIKGPGEANLMKTPDYFNNDPYKSNLG